ncbi:MAG: hypothetical protein M9887_12335 [Chitinophagales bacterium]|nr:hypothetical protein [Chitinophagales bacterium]
MVIFIGIAFFLLLYVILVIAYAWFTQYRPQEITNLKIENGRNENLTTDTITIYTWNIGYAGLDKNSDFFYDGGKMVRPSKVKVESNFSGICQEIHTWDDADVTFLQEVDIDSKRSWNIPQVEVLKKQERENRNIVFALNYDVKFVPKPFFNPMGKVSSGIMTFTRWQPQSAQRVSYPGQFPFPTGLFFLNRCFLVMRISYKNKELVLINTHNSAFDGGTLKIKEMEMLKAYLIKEYKKGNYVIVGGDWNQIPPDFQENLSERYEETQVPLSYPDKNWKWVADLSGRSNRKVDTPYIKGVTYTTILDFYLISPNVEMLSVATKDLDFTYSDHNPVKAVFKLRD